jgi:hypothetical protein
MALPGFSAEASVGPTTQVYRVQDRYGTAGVSDVYPQLNGGEWDEGLEEEGLEEEGLEEAEAMDMAAEEDAEFAEEV